MTTDETDLKFLLKALKFASIKHKNQHRKDAEASPYINHPIDLATILCNEGHITDIEVIVGALLHDTVEDTETTPDELEAAFGSTIREIVMDVTDDKSLPKVDRKLKQIEHAAHACDKAKLIKLADKISNLRDIVSSPPEKWSTERKQEYFDWAKRVIDQVRGIDPKLESIFDGAYSRRPHSE